MSWAHTFLFIIKKNKKTGLTGERRKHYENNQNNFFSFK